METNMVRRAYRNTELLLQQMEREKPVTEEKGLLASRRKRNTRDDMSSSPAYRVAEYFQRIREKRMALKNEG